MKTLLAAVDRRCRDFVAGLVDALHVSRSAEARRLLHRHRQLRDDGRGALPLDTISFHKKRIFWKMPTNVIRRPAVTTPAGARAASVSSLAIVAIILLTALHVAAAAMSERSHALPAPGAVIESIDDDASCPAKAVAPAPALPFD